MKVVLVLLALVLIAVIAAPAWAQARGQSPTDDAPAATITGRVVADSSGDPIPNARVTLSPESLALPVVLTDADGRFSLAAPAGVHSVAVRKAGYARDDATASAPGRAVEIRLKRGAAISGQILDELGDPVIGIRVTVLKQTGPVNALTMVGEADTDDRGAYRIGGLSEGTFLVSITIETPRQNPGSSLVLASQQQTYYPGAATPGQAQDLHLQPGDDRNGVDFVVPAGHSSGLSLATLAFQLRRPPLPNSAPRGTGVVRGRVADFSGRPIGHAQVLVFAATRADSRATTTDDDGAFEVGELGAGTVRISATKLGYTQLESGRPVTPSSLRIGSVRAGTLSNFAWGRAIHLAAGEIRERVELTLARWATLSGHIVDEYGEPIQGVAVQLLHVRYETGQRRLVVVEAVTGTTDDLGQYRIHTLAPSQYIVSAAVGQASSEDLPGYARSYYPGTPSPGEAQFVSVGLSQDVAAIDFSLARVRTARVSGQTLNPAGEPAPPGSLILMPSQRSSSLTSVPVGARVGADGAFVFPSVPPGEYVIQAHRGRLNLQTEGEFGALQVVVNGTDVTGLRLQTSSGSSITGRFTFDASDPTKTAKPSEFELAPIPADFDLSPPENWATAEIHPDWTFQIAGLSGPRRLQILRAPAGWALKEIRLNGIDITDKPLSLGERGQSLTDVEVMMTDRIGALDGTVADVRAQPAPGSNIVVFSTDRGRWYPASRYLRQTASGPDGSFTVAGLPTGSYYASAVARIPKDGEDAWQDPQFLESLVARASTVAVVDGQRAHLVLRLAVP